MNYFDKVQNYLLELEYEVVGKDEEEQILVITDQDRGICNMLLDCEGEVLIMEQHILNIDTKKPESYKRLLQINREIVHGAFVLDEAGDKVIFRDTLQLANLDVNELEASLNALALALAENADEFLSLAERN